MSTVVVTAVFHAAEGRRDDLAAALRDALPDVHAEDGCELYALHSADDGTLVLIEKWTSREALAAHAAGEPVARLNAAIAPHLAAPAIVTTMDAIPAGDAGRGTL